MTLDPSLAAILPFMSNPDAPAMTTLSPQQARDGMAAMIALGQGGREPWPVEEVADIRVDGAEGELAARVYRPAGAGPHPTLVFFHGGGFVLGDLQTHDEQVRMLCDRSQVVVVAVDYRLAPEHPFPAGVNDAFAATRWAGEHLAELGGDSRLAVGGDSAGGNFAAVVAQRWHATGQRPALAAQLLLYPSLDMTGSSESVSELAEGYFLTGEDMLWFHGHYLSGGGDPTDPMASPLLAPDVSGLAPAVVATGQFDPLRDEGNAYAARLEQAGVPVRGRCFDGLIHGFFGMGQLSPAAADAAQWCCQALAEVLAEQR
jgi:acetyl esterase